MTEGERPVGEKDDTVTLSRQEYEKLIEQANELEAARDSLLRRAADYDNARKRLAKEREEFVLFSQERLLRELLPILDNFQRALTHSELFNEQLVAGIQLIEKQLLDVLKSHGVKRFDSEGERFDPHLHEAVGHVVGEGPEGVVVEEVAAGYKLHDRVLRPAKVKIRAGREAKEGQAAEEEKEEEIT